MITARNIHYEMADKSRGINCGGIGAIHMMVNRIGLCEEIDRAIEVVAPHAGRITLRGDTDFTLTGELDRWDKAGIGFIFGMDAHQKVVGMAGKLPEEAWQTLDRLPVNDLLSNWAYMVMTALAWNLKASHIHALHESITNHMNSRSIRGSSNHRPGNALPGTERRPRRFALGIRLFWN